MARIIGLLISGFGVRLMGAGLALYVGITVYHFVVGTFTQVSNALNVIPG